MNETGDLFADTRHREAIDNARNAEARKTMVRRSDPPTSTAAAETALLHATESRLTVLRLLCERPLTDFELADLAGSQQTSIGKRRLECQRAGLVRPFKIGHATFTRPSPSGANATVWEITAEGRKFLREAI